MRSRVLLCQGKLTKPSRPNCETIIGSDEATSGKVIDLGRAIGIGSRGSTFTLNMDGMISPVSARITARCPTRYLEREKKL